MATQPASHRLLPCTADRLKIIEQAKLVLAEARATAERWDRSFGLPSPEYASTAALSFVATGAAGPALGD